MRELEEDVPKEEAEPNFSILMCALILCGIGSIIFFMQRAPPTVAIHTPSRTHFINVHPPAAAKTNDSPQQLQIQELSLPSGLSRRAITNSAGQVVGGGRPIRVSPETSTNALVAPKDDKNDHQTSASLRRPPQPQPQSQAPTPTPIDEQRLPHPHPHVDSPDPLPSPATSVSPTFSPPPANNTQAITTIVDLFSTIKCSTIPSLPISHTILSPRSVAAQLHRGDSDQPDASPATGRRGIVGAVRRLYKLREESSLKGDLSDETNCWRRLGFKDRDLRDAWLYLNLFQYYPNPGTFVEYPAKDGVVNSTTWVYEKLLSWAGICVEPSEEVYAQLQRNRPRCASVLGSIVAASPSPQPTTQPQTQPSSTVGVNLSTLLEDQEISRVNLLVLDCATCHLEVLTPLLTNPSVSLDVFLAPRPPTDAFQSQVANLANQHDMFELRVLHNTMLFVNLKLAAFDHED
eukprot:c4328_g1_i1.p1 GENE.c4328_g1_i1~~c4328_g1_i1.p1  ORF type:complete len:461 (+),score=46.56 c4328_g1_i1:18-1400(+)